MRFSISSLLETRSSALLYGPRVNRRYQRSFIAHAQKPERTSDLRPVSALIAIAIGLGVWLLPQPAKVSDQGRLMLAMFIGTIAAIIGKAMPLGGLSMIAIVLVAANHVTSNDPGDAIRNAIR